MERDVQYRGQLQQSYKKYRKYRSGYVSLEKSGKIDDLGRSLALRAFLQFDMLRLFAPAPVTQPGGRKFIPYINVYPSYISNPKTVDECLTLITEDLKEAKKLLWQIDTAKSFSPSVTFEMSGTGDNIFFYRRGYHMNYWAATALLARVYLYAQKETEALEQANEIITFVAKIVLFRLIPLPAVQNCIRM